MDLVKTISYSQEEIIGWISRLHLDDNQIELDPTYSKGGFYKSGIIPEPLHKSDLYPQVEGCIQSEASDLLFDDGSIGSIMFDPPFLAGYTKKKPTGKMGVRFHGFRYVKDLWEWYEKCLLEFNRVLKKKGVLIFKCQDTVSSGKQHFSHVFIMNKAEEYGFYCKDLFVLLAENRMIGHNHNNQKHARKFHSYFLVFIKKIDHDNTQV